MANADSEQEEPNLATLSRAAGYLCVIAAGLKDEPLVHSAGFLLRLGYSKSDCAAILDTTPETIRVTLAQAKNRNGSTKTKLNNQKRTKK